MSSGVVGRDEELSFLRDFVSSIPGGAVSLTLEGDAGVGKTTLWAEGVRQSEEAGYRVLSARPAESETALSFSGIGDLLDPVLEQALAPLSAAQHRALSRALVLGDDEGPPPDPHAIGVALLTALRSLADDLPVVVAVDDVQWLDAASAAGLAYAARRLRAERVGVLLAHRSGLDSALLGELGRLLPTERTAIVHVGSLDVGALHHVVRAELGVVLARPLLTALREASGGNPFYALEIVRTMQRRGVSSDTGEPLPVPESLHDLVHGRLLALPPRSRDFLLAAAAHAHPTIALTEAASGVDRHMGLQPALEARIVELDGPRIRFTHPLLAAGAYESADRGRRAEVHARLAQLLDDPEAQAWQLAASVDSPAEAVAAALEDAAQHARSRGALRPAALMLDRASELTPAERPDDALRRAVEAAYLHFESGDSRRAETQLRALIAPLAPGPARARATVVLARIRLYEAPHEAADLFARVVEEAEDDRQALAIAHEGAAACCLWLFERFDDVLQHTEAALRLAEEMGDEALIADVLMTRLSGEVLLGRPTAAATAERAGALQDSAADRRILDQPLVSLVEYWKWIDAHESARSALLDLLRRAQDMGDENAPPWLLCLLGDVERLSGNLELALERAQEGRAAAEQSGQQLFAGLNLALESLCHAQLGQVNDGTETAHRVLAQARDNYARLVSSEALAHASLTLGRTRRSLDISDRSSRSPARRRSPSPVRPASQSTSSKLSRSWDATPKPSRHSTGTRQTPAGSSGRRRVRTAFVAEVCSRPKPESSSLRSPPSRRRSRGTPRSTSRSTALGRCWRSARRSAERSAAARPVRPSEKRLPSSSASALRSGQLGRAPSSAGSADAHRRPGRSRRPRSASPSSSPRGGRTRRSQLRSSSPVGRSRGTSPGSTGSSGSATGRSWALRWLRAKPRGLRRQTHETRPFQPIRPLPSLETGGREGHQEKEERAMTPKISLITAVVLGAALALAAPAFAGPGGAGQQQTAVHVSPDLADRAAAAHQAELARIHFAREDRVFATKKDLLPIVTPDPVRDDYFLDSSSIAAPTATASSGRDIEWPQIGIGFAGGVLLSVMLLLALRMPRVRQPAH